MLFSIKYFFNIDIDGDGMSNIAGGSQLRITFSILKKT